MKSMVSIFNDVLGPIMRGPSSSHTAAAYRLGKYVGTLFPHDLSQVEVIFRKDQTFARTYKQQKSDIAFTAGLLGIELTSKEYSAALSLAQNQGIQVLFSQKDLPWASHPNDLEIVVQAVSLPVPIHIQACSLGGGSIAITRFDSWLMKSSGDAFDLLVLGELSDLEQTQSVLGEEYITDFSRNSTHFFLRRPFKNRPNAAILGTLKKLPLLQWYLAEPVAHVIKGTSLFHSATGVLAHCDEFGCSIGQAGISYEMSLLDISEEAVYEHLNTIQCVMRGAVHSGLNDPLEPLNILTPSSRAIGEAEKNNELPFGGLNTQAAFRALAAMETCSSGGVVCAAPTAGSAGIMPAAMWVVEKNCRGDQQKQLSALMAGAVVGLAIAQRGSFAAETGGCQVEVGASAAMACASFLASVDACPSQIFEGAGIMLQTFMGLICDPVKGYVELPCHIRNALATSCAITAADLVRGGYKNPVPFDEVVDAMMDTGNKLPLEFRCTMLGGIAHCPSMK